MQIRFLTKFNQILQNNVGDGTLYCAGDTELYTFMGLYVSSTSSQYVYRVDILKKFTLLGKMSQTVDVC